MTCGLHASRAAWLVTLVTIAPILSCGDSQPDPAGNVEVRVLLLDERMLVESVTYEIGCESDPSGERLQGSLTPVDEPEASDQGSSIWSGFLDLPPDRCLVQLRGTDEDGEVLCTASEPFNVLGPPTMVNTILSCNLNPAPPLQPTNNACPDLFPFECADFDDGATATSCEVKFRDSDDTCADACDPQTCTAAPTGIACTPGPDPGVSSLVTCDANALDCEGDGILDESCTFRETDQQFVVDCQPPDAEGFAGATIACAVITTDGDEDCNKTKTVEIECPLPNP